MVSFFALLFASTVAAPDSCAHDLARLDDARRAAYASAVQNVAGKPTGAGAIEAVLASGRWRAVWARPDDSEPGVFVFRREPAGAGLRYLDVWGGALGPDGPEVVVQWARRTTHMPPPFAKCVADRVYNDGP